MKNFLPIALLLTAQVFYAQEHDPVVPNVDSMLVNIETTGLTSGILYERVYPIAGLDQFNDSIHIANVDYFEQALYELYLASNKEKFMPYRDLQQLYVPDDSLNSVNIGVINAMFHKLNYNPENEEQGGLRIVDSLFEKIENGQSAFLPKHLFMASPLKKYVKGNRITFRFDSLFVLQDTQGNNIQSLTADFGTGIVYVLMENGEIVNNEIEVEYSDSGLKILSFTAGFSDGTSLTNIGTINVTLTPGQVSNGLVEDGSISANIPYQGTGEPAAFNGFIKYRIFYRNGATQKKLMKPIIIIDGFDPGDKRKIEDKDSNEPADKHKSILEVMKYTDIAGFKKSILDTLRGIGYDVIIVNHPTYHKFYQLNNPPLYTYQLYTIDGGADFIQRNAMAHIALYQRLDSLLAVNNSNEELVIIGPSMGGQISRYALAYMEEQLVLTGDQKWDHNTRLWVSVDSPHLGANVPMGAQALLNLLADKRNNAKAKDYVLNSLGSPAAKQQLISQYKEDYTTITILGQSYIIALNDISQDWLNGRTTGQGFSQNRGHPFFVDYYNDLYSNGLAGSRGYPQNTRRIAVVNGALTGSNAFGNPFYYNWIDVNNGIITPDNYAPDNDKVFRMEGHLEDLFDTHVATLEYYFMPSTSNYHKVAYLRVRGQGFLKLNWNFYHRYITNNDSRGSIDNLPAGWYPTQQEIAEGIVEAPNSVVDYWLVDRLEHVSSFIPTVSALGFISPDFNWHEDFERDLDCTDEIPFDNYYGPKENELHTSFTQESVEWILAELAGNPQPSPLYYDAEDIAGDYNVCGETTYSLPYGMCGAYAVSFWGYSNNLQVVSQTAFSITVEPKNPNTNGPGYIETISPFDVVRKEVWVGAPNDQANLQTIPAGSTQGGVGIGTSTTFHASSISPGLQYVWEIHYNNNSGGTLPMFTPQNTNKYTTSFTGNQAGVNWGNVPGTYAVSCSIKNQCGEGDTDYFTVTVGESGSGDPCDYVYMLVYPNPVTDDWINVEMIYPPDFDPPCPFGPGYYGETINNFVEIYDLQGNLEYSNNFYELEFTITEMGLESGNYILNITSSNGKTGQEVIIVE